MNRNIIGDNMFACMMLYDTSGLKYIEMIYDIYIYNMILYNSYGRLSHKLVSHLVMLWMVANILHHQKHG